MTKNNDLPQQLSDEEWVASKKKSCHHCGSLNVQAIACWQFPDG